ncbi:gamma-glutamylcyclotransferase [Rossellomorea aquimaris]|uniref:Gamma-glutamylcyclotransferase n=2 Tax=Bacillaceae TaxID=186817 RepID=A0A5D4U6R3_9BACI|nr:gamma-glutamylcyclotransferase [Rossellomorea aquimaris]
METMKLFVYGSLRKNQKYHYYLEKSSLVSEQAWMKGELYDTGEGYPALKEGIERVFGEIYEINPAVLANIDELEDYKENRDHNLYLRQSASAQTDKGPVDVIYYTGFQSSLFQEHIASGDWTLHTFMQQKPESLLYFAYGSCMDLERFKLAGVDQHFREPLGKGVLNGYSMKYTFIVEDGGRGDILEDGGVTEGIVYRLPFDAVDYLYKREGVVPGNYRAALVNIEVNDVVIPNVLTFIVNHKGEETRPPAHYAREILRGARPFVSQEYHLKLKKQLLMLGMSEQEVEGLLSE